MAMEKTYEVIDNRIIRIGQDIRLNPNGTETDPYEVLSIQIGDIETLESDELAYVSAIKIDSADSKYLLNFGIPRGRPASITNILNGNCYTVEPGEPARVELRKAEGIENALYIDFWLPKGTDGTNGQDGTNGDSSVIMPTIMTGKITIGDTPYAGLRNVGEVYYLDLTLPKAPSGICPSLTATCSGRNADQEPTVDISYTGNDTYNLHFGLARGSDGKPPTMQIGYTSALSAGSPAYVSMTSSITYNNAVYTLNFGIPRGEKGEPGPAATSCLFATSAGYAASAGSCTGTAAYASNAGNATSANKANSATSAGYAASAGSYSGAVASCTSAKSAGSAASAASAGTAAYSSRSGSANSAGYATSAGTAAYALSLSSDFKINATVSAGNPFGVLGTDAKPPYVMVQSNTNFSCLENYHDSSKYPQYTNGNRTLGGYLIGTNNTTSIVYNGASVFLKSNIHSCMFGMYTSNATHTGNRLVFFMNQKALTSGSQTGGRGVLQLMGTGYATCSVDTDNNDVIVGIHGSIMPVFGADHYIGNQTLPWNRVYTKRLYMNENSIYKLNGTLMDANKIKSDKRLKTDIEDIPEEVLEAVDNIKLKQFKFKESIKEKGEEDARIHVGIIAQEAKEAFKKKSLEPTKYSFYCYDKWNSYKEDINEKIIVHPGGEEYSIVYFEYLVLKCAAQDKKIKDMEARIKALEEKLNAIKG